MPLVKSPTKQAFKTNIRREIAVGKPAKQVVAIAYRIKARSNRRSNQRSSVK